MDNKKTEFIDAQMLKLQGKDYLPVAPRIVLFRQAHPEWSIRTMVLRLTAEGKDGAEIEFVETGKSTYVKCEIGNERGQVVATAHKMVRIGGKGPAAQFPLETAETGAVGRALGLCGFGTLAGDLDEGDQIADAPIERAVEPANSNIPTQVTKSRPGKTELDLGALLVDVASCATVDELNSLTAEVWELIKDKSPTDPDRIRAKDLFQKMRAKVQ